ncbi:unnamed protein product [Linum tenue]|uniref:Cytochrome P450 n=1 Tax=Linum tenue TaxID=586396 RepID=A0AAV0M059_9ROSI|nr:unnamed protein product [Linum tenue]
MDLLLQQALPIFFLLLTIIIFSRKIRAGDGKTGHRQLAPAPGWKLPVIGHLHHFLTSRQLPHRLLRELARKHGDMIRLDLGEIQHVLVSSAEAAKEVMRTHDIKFAQRPSHPSLDKVMYGGIDLIHAPYGDYWRQLRRIATLELLTAKRVDSLRRVREAEITERQVAAAAAGSTIDLTKMLFNLTYRIISMSTFGDVSKEPEEFMKVAEELVEYAGGFKISFLFPSCGLVQRLFGTTEWLDGVHKVTDRLMESMIGQHRSKRALEKQKGFHLSTDAIKAFLLDIFLAGSETPATLIEWTMAEMIRNPEVMHKAQSEVRKVFGERGKVEESKIHELTYLKLVIKETLRLHTPTPLVLPRECREECRIFGYDIPLKTRFLDEKVNFRGTDFEFLPFGAGRRMCPGISFGLAVVELLLANLLFHFDWKLPGGAEPESLNMDEQFGVSLRKKNHLELIPVVQYNPLPPA